MPIVFVRGVNAPFLAVRWGLRRLRTGLESPLVGCPCCLRFMDMW
jgi:hypothetical protein